MKIDQSDNFWNNVRNMEISSVKATIYMPKTYCWKPKDDITTLELAKCIPMFTICTAYRHADLEMFYNKLPEECKRHWELT